MLAAEDSKDWLITSLIGQAEKLVSDLEETVARMKLILADASEDIEEAKDARRRGGEGGSGSGTGGGPGEGTS